MGCKFKSVHVCTKVTEQKYVRKPNIANSDYSLQVLLANLWMTRDCLCPETFDKSRKAIKFFLETTRHLASRRHQNPDEPFPHFNITASLLQKHGYSQARKEGLCRPNLHLNSMKFTVSKWEEQKCDIPGSVSLSLSSSSSSSSSPSQKSHRKSLSGISFCGVMLGNGLYK